MASASRSAPQSPNSPYDAGELAMGSVIILDNNRGRSSVISSTRSSRPCWAWAITVTAWTSKAHSSRPQRIAAGHRGLRVPQPVGGLAPRVQAGFDLTTSEQDLRAYAEIDHRETGGFVPTAARRQLQPALRLIDGAALEIGEHHRPPQAGRGGPCPDFLHDRQRRAQVNAGLVSPVDRQTQLAHPGVGEGREQRRSSVLECRECPPGRLHSVVQVVVVFPDRAGHAVGDARQQRVVAGAQGLQGCGGRSRSLRQGTQHNLHGPGQGVRWGRRKTAEGDQGTHRPGTPDEERVHGGQYRGRPGGLDEFGLGSVVR